MYVSDLIETFFPGIANVRDMLRSCVVDFFYKPSDEVSEYIISRLNHYGGKCMGYPSVWFVASCLGYDNEAELMSLIKASLPAIILSLSTSIMDDLFDGNENVFIEDVIIFYYMMAYLITALRDDSYAYEQVLMAIQKAASNIVFMKTKKLNLADDLNINTMATVNSDKIGIFYECIASCLIKSVDLDPTKKQDIIELTKYFGRWCAEIDDAIDTIDDLENGVTDTYPILQYKKIVSKIPVQNRSEVLNLIKTQTISRQKEKLILIINKLKSIDCDDFAKNIEERLDYISYEVFKKMALKNSGVVL